LTRQEEYLLVHCYQNDIQKTDVADVVILCNMGLIRTMVTKYLNRGLPYDDLMNAGMMAVLVVLERFDIDKKNRLSTVLVPWIHQHMGRAINNTAKVIRIPDHMCAKVVNYSKHESTFRLQHGRMPTFDEMQLITGWPTATMNTILHAMELEPISMDDTVTTARGKLANDEPKSPLVNLSDGQSSNDYAAVLDRHPNGSMPLALSLLDQRELSILMQSHGLDGHEQKTYLQIGKALGITRQRVDQILQKAYAKIRDAGFTIEDFT
jgi:RNA polymerase primary sigma factor